MNQNLARVCHNSSTKSVFIFFFFLFCCVGYFCFWESVFATLCSGRILFKPVSLLLSQVLPQLKFWILIILLLGLTQISLQVVTSKINLKVLLMPQGKCSVSSASMLCVNS